MNSSDTTAGDGTTATSAEESNTAISWKFDVSVMATIAVSLLYQWGILYRRELVKETGLPLYFTDRVPFEFIVLRGGEFLRDIAGHVIVIFLVGWLLLRVIGHFRGKIGSSQGAIPPAVHGIWRTWVNAKWKIILIAVMAALAVNWHAATLVKEAAGQHAQLFRTQLIMQSRVVQIEGDGLQ